ncbi:uncharacterized protein LOC117122797 [Anneissia japonica]|uniref:uncharacterized protein LOC117122797 n=1 Tax=Anneissia japonica TaxID=1529436 RepID=UPI00142593E2|nr:uncharacterized protein LOC117122797 [Anneissia japonica]
MQIPFTTLFPLFYLFTTVGSARLSSFSSDYGESSDAELTETPVVASGDGSNPLTDLDAEDETFTTEIIELATTQITTLKPTTTESRVRIPQTCCELGALAARQGHSCRPESHREKLR